MTEKEEPSTPNEAQVARAKKLREAMAAATSGKAIRPQTPREFTEKAAREAAAEAKKNKPC